MTTLNITEVKNAKLAKVLPNSVLLEVAPNKRVYCHRNVFNQIVNSTDELPCFAVERENYSDKTGKFTKTLWVAIPKTF